MMKCRNRVCDHYICKSLQILNMLASAWLAMQAHSAHRNISNLCMQVHSTNKIK